MIGIIGAMDVEVDGIKKNIEDLKTEEVSGIKFCTGKLFGKEPTFVGTEGEKALFSNCQKMVKLMGYPSKGVLEMMDMVAQWITQGGEVITAPTHFETVDGKF